MNAADKAARAILELLGVDVTHIPLPSLPDTGHNEILSNIKEVAVNEVVKLPIRSITTIDPAEHELSLAATQSWQWIKAAEAAKGRTFDEWMKVGNGFLAGRALAMRKAGVVGSNQPDHRLGSAYNTAFSEWLRDYKLADIDHKARASLLRIMTEPEILVWYMGLPEKKRHKFNHPTVIVRNYKLFKAAALFPDPTADKAKKSRDVSYEAMAEQLDTVRKELVQLKIKDRKRCDVDLLHSGVVDIESWLEMRALPDEKAIRIRNKLLLLYPPKG